MLGVAERGLVCWGMDKTDNPALLRLSFWPLFPTWTPLSHLSGTPGLTAAMASGWCTLDGICSSQVSEFREVGAVSVVHLTMLGSVRAWSHQWILKVYSVESFCSYN